MENVLRGFRTFNPQAGLKKIYLLHTSPQSRNKTAVRLQICKETMGVRDADMKYRITKHRTHQKNSNHKVVILCPILIGRMLNMSNGHNVNI